MTISYCSECRKLTSGDCGQHNNMTKKQQIKTATETVLKDTFQALADSDKGETCPICQKDIKEVGDCVSAYHGTAWQDRFEEKFQGRITIADGNITGSFARDYIKKFIQSEIDSAVNIALSKHREKVKEKIENMMNGTSSERNKLLQDIKNII